MKKKIEACFGFQPRHAGNEDDLAYGRELRERLNGNVKHAVEAAQPMGHRQQLHVAEHIFESAVAEADKEKLCQLSLEVTITGDDGRGKGRHFWEEL